MKRTLKHLLRKTLSAVSLLTLLGTIAPITALAATSSISVTEFSYQPAITTQRGTSTVNFGRYGEVNDTLAYNATANSCTFDNGKVTVGNMLASGSFWTSKSFTLALGFGASFVGNLLPNEMYVVERINGGDYVSRGIQNVALIDTFTNSRVSNNAVYAPSSSNWTSYEVFFSPVYQKTSGTLVDDYVTSRYSYGCKFTQSATSTQTFNKPTSVTAIKSGSNMNIEVGVPSGENPGGLLLEFHPAGDINTVLFAATYSVGGLSPLKINNGKINLTIPYDQLQTPGSSGSDALVGSKVGSSNDAMFKIESIKGYRVYASLGSYARSGAILDNKSGFTASGDVGTGTNTNTNTGGGTTTDPYGDAATYSASIPIATNGKIVKIEYVGEKLYLSFEDKGSWAVDPNRGYVFEVFNLTDGGKIASDTAPVDSNISSSATIPYRGVIKTSPTGNPVTLESGKQYQIRVLRAYRGEIRNVSDYLYQNVTARSGTLYDAGEFTQPTDGFELTPPTNISNPQNLKVLKAGGDYMTLQWDTINCGATNTLRYKVRANGTEKSNFVANSTMSVPKVEHTVYDLESLTPYTFEVEAQCSNGSSTTTTKSTTTGNTTFPEVSNDIPEISGLRVLERDYKNITLAWNEINCGLGNTLTYTFKQNGTQVKSYVSAGLVQEGTPRKQEFNDLTANTPYTFDVEAQCKSGTNGSVVTKKAQIVTATTENGKIQLSTQVLPVKGESNRYAVVLKRENDHPDLSGDQDVWSVAVGSTTFAKTYTKSGTTSAPQMEVSDTSSTCTIEEDCNTNAYGYYICVTNRYLTSGKPTFNDLVAQPLYIFNSREAVVLDKVSTNAAGKYSVAVVGGAGLTNNCMDSVVYSTQSHIINSNIAEFTIPTLADTTAPVFSSELAVTAEKSSGSFMGGNTFYLQFGVNEPNIKSCTVSNGVETHDITCAEGTNNKTVVFSSMPSSRATITVKVTDTMNQSATSTDVIDLDQDAPTVQASIPALYKDGESTITLTCSDSKTGCAKVEYTSGTIAGQCTTVTNGWTSVPESQLASYTIPSLENGAQHLCVRGEDKVGNKTAGTRYTLVREVPVVDTFVPPVITGGTPLNLSGTVSSTTIPLGITFTAGKDVSYTITENNTESQKFPYTGNIYMTEGTHTNFYITFYDEKGNKIGTAFGPYTITVSIEGATLTMPTTVLRTKEASVTLPITSLSSNTGSVSYTVTINGEQKASGQRSSAEFGTAFNTPAITLNQNAVNEVVITLTDANSKVSMFKRTIIHDSKAPVVTLAKAAIENDKAVWSFSAIDANQGTVASVQAQVRNSTTGERSSVITITQNSQGMYQYEVPTNDMRPGHEYVLAVRTVDDMQNTEDYVTSNSLIKAKTSVDQLDMLQKLISVNSTLITSEEIEVTIANNDIRYTATLPKGKYVVFGDILSKGVKENSNNTKLSKLPVGNYTVYIQTKGLASNKVQTVQFMVTPYYADQGGDLNGDQHVGMTDRYFFNQARNQGLYTVSDGAVATLVNAIEQQLNNAMNQNIDTYLKY